MTETEPENLVLRMLREMLSDLRSMHEDVRDVRRRVGHLEGQGAHLEGSIAMVHSLGVQQNARMDDIADRLVRIKSASVWSTPKIFPFIALSPNSWLCNASLRFRAK